VVHDARAGFDTARSNRACDDGIEGPPTETQTDASRRTRLGARNGLQWAAHLDLLHISLLDRLDQLHSGSEPSLYSRASSTHEPPTRPTVGACPNWQRDAPPSCAPASPPAGRHAQRAKRPRIRQEPPRQAAARRTSGTASPGSPPQQQARFHLDGPRCPISPRPPTEGSGPVLGPCALPNPEAEAKAEAESRRGARLLRAKSSDPHINRVLTASGTCSPCGGNTRGSQTHGLAYVGANPRPQCRAHATRFGQRRLGGCLDRMQPVARQCSSVQPVAACAVRSGIAHRWHSVATQVALACNTVHVVATQCVWLVGGWRWSSC